MPDDLDGLDAELDAELNALVEPLRSRVRILDSQIETQEATVTALRAQRTRAQKALALLDPESVPVKKKTGPKLPDVSELTVAAIEKKLREKILDVNGNGGFTATSLRRDHGFDELSLSTISKALAVLHDRQLIRLDHRGRGGAHYYKVVA